MPDLDLRASDDDRQAAIDRLSAHFRSGRLDAEELEERTAAANAAKTYGELAALEADLPAPPAPVPSRVKQTGEKLAGALAFSAIFWVIWLATGAHGFVWPLIPTAVALLGALGEDGSRDRRRHHHGRHRHQRRPPRRLP
ncbi:MAG TPA: DUF1707 domain-containing protein [Baekduia sp.]|uniref:DUF1707 SHOCT-like domain-containing protein n=1 Tax=Baekduia sp. TaxID=2600305 RepID=UPI002D7730AE|nr:DUF1707 domain-containing protein [Baekduia sp.]HET6505515.1 DUF1707 domain-containing protein [Baekduia sp.]